MKAQEIVGKVVEQNQNQNPLSYVTILLKDLKGNLVKATITDENGKFRFKEIMPDEYLLSISYLGFKTIQIKTVVKNTVLDLKIVEMELEEEELEGVTVIAEKPVIQVEPDKTVFNVDGTIGNAGVNGLELMRKAPGVRLDNNDAIIVEGKAGVLVYIDGRQSFLEGSDLTAYLQTLNADTIESIEIITQPSSKYDAAGNAGIINIRLKREKGLGTRGSISSTLTIGDYVRTNNSISFTSRLKKWNMYGSYSNYVGRSTGFLDLYRVQGDKIFDAKTNSEYDRFSNNIRFGTDYYASKRSTVGAMVSFNSNDSDSRSTTITPIIDRATQRIDSILKAPNSSENETRNFNVNLNYRYQDTSGTSLSADLDYGNYIRDRFNNQPNFYTTANGEILNTSITQQITPIHIEIFAGKLDYERKVGKGILETGVKVSQVNTDNTFDFFNEINGESVLNLDRSNQFGYDEKIYAGYVKYNYSRNKWKFQAGLRSETTDSRGILTADNENADETVSRSYTDIFPSAGITYQASQNNSLALLYSRRIQRPNYQDLNPFEYQLDELSFRRGNPFLQPQYTDNIKLSHIYKYTLTTSFSYSFVSDFFAQVTEAVGENTNFLSTRNVADQQVYNLSFSYPFKVNNWWRAYANVYGSYNKYTATNPAFISTSQKTFGLYAQNTFSLPKNYKLEISGWYSSPSIWGGTYETNALGSLNLAIQKTWDNWTVKATVNDILYTIPWSGTTQFGDLFISGSGGSDSRNFNFYIQYAFGNKEVKNAGKRKGGTEDEEQRVGG
ncbi:TonB-dependent receptor domain-containing protein [Aquimarina sp. SS2-1]|uniref:TonB-dependent receptor domain-containing protein n=1 Tax=Aquimarina besae TaxID=3342247 RepID=UPI003672ECC7